MPPSLSSSTLCCCYSIPHIPRCRTADLIILMNCRNLLTLLCTCHCPRTCAQLLGFLRIFMFYMIHSSSSASPPSRRSLFTLIVLLLIPPISPITLSTPRSHALYSDTASSWDGWEPSSSSLQLPTSFPVPVARSRALALCGLLDSVGANSIFAPSAYAPALHCCALAFQLLFGHVGATLFTGALRHITTSAAAIQHWIWPLPG
ncbi:hypothetical protein B0H14DRAFT_2997394 [Mycena olivaceomarginata]|nr:hypothetical protein B0H14DRAFT_2997394 [Mycena olivaceomarginata]